MSAFAATLLVNLLVVGTVTEGKTAKKVALHPIESKIIAHTNAERARFGRRPLVLDRSLLNSARRHAIWMTRTRSLRHTSAMVAENIAMGQNSASQVVRDWMNSPGHRANILDNSNTRIGVAAYRAPDGTVYWCQQFRR